MRWRGRPKSARSKVSERFLSDLHELWQQCGPAVLKRLAEEKPADLVRAVVAVLPKEVDLQVNQYETMSDEQLRAQLRAALREAAELGIDLGTLDEPLH